MFSIEKIVKKIRTSLQKHDVFFIAALVLSYFASRLLYLNRFPIFSDEGIYIRWAKVAWHDPAWRFISLTDGKQPLQTWGTIPFFKLFSNDLLLGGRMFAVVTGFFALVGIYMLLLYVFDKKTALWGAFLYIVTPYFLFYDRLALVDSGVNAFFIWILFTSIILVQTVRLDVALIFGMLSGLALLAKSSVRLFVALAIFAPIMEIKKQSKRVPSFLSNYIILYGVGVAIAITIYNVQRLSPFFQYVAEKNKTFIMTPQEFIHNPIQVAPFNLVNLPILVLWESGAVICVLGFCGMYLLYKHKTSFFLYLMTWMLVSFVPIVLLTKVLYPRYIIFFATMLLIPAAYFLGKIKNRSILLVCVLATCLSVAYFDYTIIAEYKHIPLPPVDRGQYIEGWPAGWGAKEIMEFAREKSATKPVIILGEGNFGMTADVLDVFLRPSDKIQIKGYWPLGDRELFDNKKELNNSFVYVVFSHRSEFPPEWPLRLIQKYDKPGNKSALYLFELTP